MPWGIVYYATKAGRVPAEEFLDGLPAKIAARFDVVLDTVREARHLSSAAAASGRQ